MGKVKTKYDYTSPVHSAERLGLHKIERLIDIMTQVLQKLDSDTGVNDTDYETLLQELNDLKNGIVLPANDVAKNPAN